MNDTTASNKQPLISVITVVYNDRDGMEKTFHNVHGQTYSRIEHIVIDGNSSDGTAEFVREQADKIERWVSEPDKGLYDAMNKGLDLASGDFCIFLNAGDLFVDSEVIRSAVELMDSWEIPYFMRSIATNGEVSRPVPPNGANITNWLKEQTPNHESVFFPRHYYQSNRYDLTFKINSDGDYMLRCFENSPPRLLDVLGLRFEMGGLSNAYSDWNVVKNWIADRQRLYSRYYPNKRFKYFKSTIRPVMIYWLKRVLGNDTYFALLQKIGLYR